MQKGQLIEASGTIYIRFYRDGKRVAEKLCQVDDKHYSTKAKSVKLLAAKFMLKENSATVPQSRLTVTEFWEAHYLPYVEANLKPSSIFGYKKLWEGTLKKHFEGRMLVDYKTHHGSEFLTSLTKRMGRTSLSHVRSLSSGIFSHAVNKGLIERNCWREVKVLARQREPKPTGHYTLEEAQAAIEKLSGDQRSQTAFGLCFYLALRPGELCGLRWEDFDGEFVHIRRSVWKDHVGTTKTAESAQKIPIIAPAAELAEKWKKASGNPDEGWLFSKGSGKPITAAGLIRSMKSTLGKSWKGLYSARRGAATALTELTGSALAAQGMLRHKSLATTLAHYKRDTPAETMRGMRMLEDAAKNK